MYSSKGETTSTMCFNGAAPARARSWHQSEYSTFVPSCFNGAAPARARSYHPNPHRLLMKKQLQWGRARAGAEL